VPYEFLSENHPYAPVKEAQALLSLLDTEGQSIERIRNEIGSSNPFRARVLMHFDCLAARRRTDGTIGRRTNLTPGIREQIATLLKTKKVVEITRTLGVDYHTVRKVGRALGDFENRRLRTKLTLDQIEQANRALKHGGG